jgi:hypothetical protein
LPRSDTWPIVVRELIKTFRIVTVKMSADLTVSVILTM